MAEPVFETFVIEPAIYHRCGQAYDAVLQSGMDALGAPEAVKQTHHYVPYLGSDSPEYPITVTFRGGVNPQKARDLASKTLNQPQTHNLISVTVAQHFLGDRLTVSGVNHLVKLSGRSWSLFGVNTQSFERR